MKIYVTKDADRTRAEAIASRLGCDVCEDNTFEELALLLSADGLSLTDGNLSMRGDFHNVYERTQKGRLASEMLVKVAKRKTYGETATAIDATAGLGEDSFLLAAAGFTVQLYEYDSVIAELLDDALIRAKADPELCAIASRMTLHKEDSIEALRNVSQKPDIVLLDPMFPERQKSALIKKKFQLLQKLEKPCSEEDALLEAALQSGAHRIIIKRPLKGPFLANKKPDYSLSGKAIRYDCIINA